MFEYILWTLLGLSIISASIIFWDVYEYIKRMMLKRKYAIRRKQRRAKRKARPMFRGGAK